MSTDVITLVLADDHTLMRTALRALLQTAADMRVVGEASSGPEAVEVAARVRPAVVVMDLDMPGGDGLTATRELREQDPHARILILTQHAEERWLVELLDAGASGYLTKDAADRELLDAIRVVARGDVYVRPRVARLLASNLRLGEAPPNEEARRFRTLSAREQSVFRQVAEGYNGREIAHQLGISAKTVDTYKQRIEEKLGITHRTGYVQLALALGLLHPSATPR